MSKPFSLALSVQLRDIAELVREEDNLRWAELRSSRNQPEEILKALRRSQDVQRKKPTRESMGGKAPLSKFGVDIEAVDNDGKTALHRAAMFSDTDKVAWLLDRGLNLEAQDNQGDTPLHYAVFYTQRAVVLLLLSKGAHVAAMNKEGWTPLHVAAGHSSSQAHTIIEDLAHGGADLEATDREGRTPLLFALEGHRKDAIDALLHAGARTDAKDGKGRSALHLAVGCSSKMAEKFLGLSPGLLEALDARGRNPLHYAAAKGVKATTLVLLKAGAAPDKVDGLGNTPMHIAEREGNDKVVDLLLEWLPAKEPTPEPEAHPIEPDAGSEGDDVESAAQSPAQGEAALPSNPVTPARGLTAAAPCASPALEAAYDRSITRAQKIQMESLQRQLKELESVVADRNALQRQVMSITAAHEAETRQLHAEKAGLQVALQAAEEGAAGLRLRVSEAGRRLADMAELRAHDAALQRRVEELARDQQARAALEAKIGKQQEEVSSFARRLAELREQLKDARAEQKADAAAYANTLQTQQVRISALQQANGALMAEAAKAHACPGEPSALGKSIQSAIALLQDSPVLRERSQNSSNIRRPSSAPGQPQATGVPASSKASEKTPPPKRPTPAKPVVKRIGGGYSMKAAISAQPAMPKMSPLSKQTRPDQRLPARSPAHAQSAAPAQGCPAEEGGAEAACPAGRADEDCLEAAAPVKDTGNPELPPASPQPRPGGAEASEDRERGTEQAPPKAPPHSFLPNLQPGRQSAAARRGQVLAGPLTRASTPQSRTQVLMKENARVGPPPMQALMKTPEHASKVSALVMSARRLAARTRSPQVAPSASKSLADSFSSPLLAEDSQECRDSM
ncbi:hypothetical protein CVIRNUC_006607 [Coccomyxa viridis]|uniref:Uncharacterized protein n=1 Tax=Coccomyxa viridis TaxID=1274662 RepID=A0AAV1I7S9_9CHLO|nr:hypothetical protein CVIRNUC_006607 [Coccomyxa viridis]